MNPIPRYGAGSDKADWPFGEFYRGHDDLDGHLLRVGRWHAQRALRLYTSEDPFDLLDAAFSVGSAVELLAKAMLAATAPTLLLSANADVPAILKYSGTRLPGREHPDAFSVRSLEAEKCMDRLRHLGLLPVWTKTDSVVFNVRNAAAHMGVVHRETLRSSVRPMVRFAESARCHLELTAEDVWGAEFPQVAATILEDEERQWRGVVEAKMAAARERLNELRASLPESTADAILKSMSGRSQAWIEHSEHLTCPVCGFEGEAHGVVLERGIGSVTVRDQVFYTSLMSVSYFECSVCRLELADESEVALAGLPSDLEFDDEDYAPEPW